MRVYISVDMEGIAGIGHEEQTDPHSATWAADYAVARRLMTEEANAAVRGSLAGGATTIYVNDSHWHCRNIIPDLLDPAAELGIGSPKPFGMVDGIDAGFDALMLVGYHAMAGTARATIDHTYNDTIHGVRLGGHPVGEIGLNSALAGWHGVPVMLVSGDRAACQEARALLGDDLDTAVVKDAIGRQAARSVHPTVARERIAAAAQEALARRRDPWVPSPPIRLEVDFVRTHHADMAELVPGSVRVGDRTVAFSHPEMPEVFRAWRAMYNLATVP